MMFGEHLRYLREKAGYSQKQMAETLGVERSTYAYYEMGKIDPSISELEKLSDAFNVSVDELVKGDLPN